MDALLIVSVCVERIRAAHVGNEAKRVRLSPVEINGSEEGTNLTSGKKYGELYHNRESEALCIVIPMHLFSLDRREISLLNPVYYMHM